MSIFRSFTVALFMSAGLPAGLCATASAQSGPVPISETQILSDISADWATIEAEGFRAFKGDSFSILTGDNRSMEIELTTVEATNSGPNRPDSLARKEGFIATFSGSDADAQWLATNGGQTVKIWHNNLGNSLAYISATPRRNGGFDFEIVLN